MVLFGRIKLHCRQNLRHDRLIEFSRLAEFLLGRFGWPFLLVVSIIDRGLIRKTDIVELPIGLRRIDVVPENFEQLLVGNLRRVVSHFDGLAVFGLVR